MKNLLAIKLLFFLLVIYSCDQNSYSPNGIDLSSQNSNFYNLFNQVLDNKTQTFSFPANSGELCVLSQSGVQICVETDCFELNGAPLNGGDISINYIEIFDQGSMVVTNKTTCDLNTGEMLLSGGEFFIEAFQDGLPLSISANCGSGGVLNINPDLSGGIDFNMIGWSGSIDADGNLNWTPNLINGDTINVVNCNLNDFPIGNQTECIYSLPFINGWNNCDVFVSWPSPKTTVTVNTPSEYTGSTSKVFVLYAGEDGGVVYFPYDGNNSFVSYNETIPVGLDIHILLVAGLSNGTFSYAIESTTVSENLVVNFSEEDLQIATVSQMEDLVNLLP